ncbi:MAG TPA: Holliday junction resolvase RuvX [Firmicutes bacterium]|nr:Holliday junction resolvase RuvX [Bacillota bacterium]
MRIMALDVGARRIGVAVSDPLGWTAQAHSVLHRRRPEEDLEALARLVAELGAERVVVGLPRRLDGSEGPAAESVKEFAGALANVIEVPVELYDERLTTVEAEAVLLSGDLSRRRRRQVVDKVAAALILDGYLRRAGGKNNPRPSGPGQETERT